MMNLKSRIDKLSASIPPMTAHSTVLDLASDAINRWRSERGLCAVEVSSGNLSDRLRPLSYDRLLSLYHSSLGIGSIGGDYYKRLRELSPDEITALYREAML